MKSYLVFSDVHGDVGSFSKFAELSKEHSGVIFAGDGYSTVKEAPLKNLYAVAGNCDLDGPPETVITLDGVRILLTHGHKYDVKASLLSLAYRAKELNCEVAIFGHTHEPFCAYEYGVMLFNPGASSGYGKKTYGVFYVKDGKPDANIFKL